MEQQLRDALEILEKEKVMKKEKIYVETVYQPSSYREPDISEYKTTKEAESFIKVCLQWGIGIVSCKILEEDKS